MTDPYEALGIDRGATADDVKRAYRARASESHPDRAGGNVATMQKVNEAYAVLSDPERKATFDSTGRTTTAPSIEREATEVLMQLFSQVLENSDGDLLGEVAAAITGGKANLVREKHRFQAKHARLARRAGKFKSKGDKNLIQMLIDQKLGDIENGIKSIEHALKVNAEADSMLKFYEGPPPVPPTLGQVSFRQPMHFTFTA